MTRSAGESRTSQRSDVPSGGRRAIMQATHDVARDRGYQQMTVSDICQAAGIVRATFYVYFANKQDAFVAMVQELIEDLFAIAGQRYPDASEYGRIVLANAAFMQRWAREREVLAEWFALSLVDDEAKAVFRDFRKRFEDRVEGRLRRLLAEGRIPECDPRLTTVALTGMLETFTRRLLDPERELGDPDEAFAGVLRTVSEAWYRTVYAEPAPDYPFEKHRLDGSS